MSSTKENAAAHIDQYIDKWTYDFDCIEILRKSEDSFTFRILCSASEF